uniref:Sulfotransferase domain-containing protein n=1 Tax=Odontella aurita TaxID=265563 RepID=A0A7S4JWP9_9STRA|mmetsp:Transcript_56046/g.167774  ORF Transcript_56046/g.167774 Transcript_56046/m.167774 type:complete len:469 (+) Transcript_56046:113-1519(+)
MFAKKTTGVIVRMYVCLVDSAKSCQTLPILTVILTLHTPLHLVIAHFLPNHLFTKNVSSAILCANLALNVAGYALIAQLYLHSVRNIFNRNIPSDPEALTSSFGAHLALLRPLEIIWRYLTAQFRVLPDVLVLGEVRCGTTTFCSHLSSIPGAAEPFCLWRHPELDGKETFYFVGHYLGHVSPSNYRMCFPLKLTKWWHERILKRPFFTFDGCAQYLSSPTAAALISKAYKDTGEPLPIMVACVRDPVDQALSWWRYENNAMAWGNGMGLQTWNTGLRSDAYPPKSLPNALKYSESTEALFDRAEYLARSGELRFLPPWSMTWPGGQLAGIGRNGRYAKNILRFEEMARMFVGTGNMNQRKCIERLQFIRVVPIETMSDGVKVSDLLSKIQEGVALRRKPASRVTDISTLRTSRSPLIRRNSGVGRLSVSDLTSKETEHLVAHFAGDVEKLEKLCGTKFRWKNYPGKD